jgi:hypothetical protein
LAHASGSGRRCFIHIGTHKTGTTYLQRAITEHAERFAEAQILVPKTGRPHRPEEPANIGHHNIAWQLSGNPFFDPEFGTLEELGAEIAASPLRDAIVSSEDFAIAYDKPDRLERLRDTCIAAGLQPTIMVYLRDQASYARSLYAMWVIDEGLAAPFERFHTLIADTQMLCVGASRLPFHYDTLLAPFARCFGEENVVVRPYRGDRAPEFLLEDFLSLLDAPLAFEYGDLHVECRLNGTASALAIMGALFRKSKIGGLEPLAIAAREGIPSAPLDRPFIGVGPDARHRFESQFCESNARVAKTYGASIVFEVPDLATWQAQDAFSRACLREWNIT